MRQFSILLLGYGHMGKAMLRGWRQQSLPIEVSAVHPSATETPYQHSYRELSALPPNSAFDVVILAVPPQIADTAMQGLSAYIHQDSLVISVMAGKSLQHLQEQLDGHETVVRVMPNMPSSLGQGICGYVSKAPLSATHQQRLDALLAATGEVIALANEDAINMVTAISGSGPAYAFLLMKAMAQAGAALGLPEDQARQFALHTVAGAGQYALQSGTQAEELLEKIAIKGGTTEAALRTLNDNDAFCSLLRDAINSAYDRAMELSRV